MLLFQVSVVLDLSLDFLPTCSQGIAVQSVVRRHSTIGVFIGALFAKDLWLEGALFLFLKLPYLLKLSLVLYALLSIFVESVEEVRSLDSTATLLVLLLLIGNLIQRFLQR